jgi:hypothetical protein
VAKLFLWTAQYVGTTFFSTPLRQEGKKERKWCKKTVERVSTLYIIIQKQLDRFVNWSNVNRGNILAFRLHPSSAIGVE